jgi:quinol-cytochrome oxidoreductase complex cytochrome b subunit
MEVAAIGEVADLTFVSDPHMQCTAGGITMLFWFLVAGVLLLVLGASFWFDHKHGRSSSDTDAMDAVRAQRARATDYLGWGP